MASRLCAVHELQIPLRSLRCPLRVLEVLDSEEATRSYKSAGNSDPFGAKVWPASHVVAERLLMEGVQGCSVLELGCGSGLVSIAAAVGGASFVLATDLVRANVDHVQESALLNHCALHAEVFDVTSEYPLPSRGSRFCVDSKTGRYHPECAEDLPEVFDYLVFSDVLYWPTEAAAFGRRAAQAYAAGTTVLIADPGRRKNDFLRFFREELRDLAVEPWPVVDAVPYTPPDLQWLSAEVRTASSLFCQEPFELILRPPRKVTSPVRYELAD